MGKHRWDTTISWHRDIEAISIAKRNPEFQYVPSAHIEIHQVKKQRRENQFCLSKMSLRTNKALFFQAGGEY